MRFLAAPSLLASLALIACGSGGGPADGGAPDSGESQVCQVDSRVHSYSAGMEVSSGDGGATFTLMNSDPAPPANQNNTWTVKIVDASGNPVTGATLSVVPTMPYMGHGTPIHPEVSEQGDGVYSIADINLFMAGIWEVAINASTPSDSAGYTVSWFFCVQG
jgi:hypothetical protein